MSSNPPEAMLNILTRSSSLSDWLRMLPAIGGEILIDKPLHWTSYDVIRFIRPLLPAYKIGHTGTLDPLATGLLILCVGKATKFVSFFQQLPKEYEAVIKLGATTATDDREAPEEVHAVVDHIDRKQLEDVLQRFVGKILQVPPAYSAIKQGGKRSYRRVRRGEKVELDPREVEIYAIDILDITPPLVHLRVRCGKGVYIRALARDIGSAMGTGGYLYQLRRTAIGPYRVAMALSPEELAQQVGKKAQVTSE